MTIKNKRRTRGFTLIEVLLALGIMTTGAVALLGFQRHVARSNRHARNVATATQIAENWVERLKVDARTWWQRGQRDITPRIDQGMILGPTEWLEQMSGVEMQFFQPTITAGTTPNISYAYDLDGLDQNPALRTHRFCSSLRFGWVRYGIALRADVRVYWPKDVVPDETIDPTAADLFLLCDDKNVELMPGGTGHPNYHVVYLSTVLRPNLPD